MLISHTHRFIFIKTVKTAGTSVEAFFEPLCAPFGHVVQHHTPTLISPQGVVGRRGPARSEPDQGFYNHMSAAELRHRFPSFDLYRRFSVVRNPYDRAVSWFHFCGQRSGGAEGLNLADAQALLAAGQTARLRTLFEDFLESVGVPDDQSLLAIDGKLAVERWLRFEELVGDISLLAHDWQIPLPAGGVEANLPRFKVIREQGPELRLYLSSRAVAVINRVNEWSFKVLGYPMSSPADY